MSCRHLPSPAARNEPCASVYFFPAKKPDPKSRSISPSLAIGLYRKVPRGCSTAAWDGGLSCGVTSVAGTVGATASERFGTEEFVSLNGGGCRCSGLASLACRRTSLQKPL